MAGKNAGETVDEAVSVDTLREALTQAKQAAADAEAQVDVLVSEQYDLPKLKRQALQDGDGAEFALLSARETDLPLQIYLARNKAHRTRMAAVDAERALLDAELVPLMAAHAELDAAVTKALQARGRNGAQIEERRQRVRLLAGSKRREEEKLAALLADYEHVSRLESAPVVRSLPHAPRV